MIATLEGHLMMEDLNYNPGRTGKKSAQKDKRTHTQCIRLSAMELRHVEDYAERAGLDIPSYIRLLIVGITPVIVPQINVEAFGQLGRVGNNLNQLVRLANQGVLPEKNEILPLLNTLLELITETRKQLNPQKGIEK
jgi:hypothetical protein